MLPTNDNKKPRRATEAEALWPPGFAAWIKVGVVYQKSSRQLARQLRSLELTVAQFDALANLYVGDGVSQQQLAKLLLVTKGNVTGLVNRLADRGLVERRSDPDDRRAYRVHLTAAGRDVARESLLVQRKLVATMMDALDGDEQEVLRQLLTRVVTKLEASG